MEMRLRNSGRNGSDRPRKSSPAGQPLPDTQSSRRELRRTISHLSLCYIADRLWRRGAGQLTRAPTFRGEPCSMNIHEYQAAELLARYGIPTNPGTVAATPGEVEQAAASANGVVVVKAQVHYRRARQSRRRQAGEVAGGSPIGRRCRFSAWIFAAITVTRCWWRRASISRASSISASCSTGRTASCVVMASAEGGVDIEDVAARQPGEDQAASHRSISRPASLPGAAARLRAGHRGRQDRWVRGDRRRLCSRLYVTELDATLAEINPLILTEEGEWLALDSKICFDDNALFRHPGIEVAARS